MTRRHAALLAPLAAAVLAAGCGSPQKPNIPEPTGDPDPAAQKVAQAYVDAYTAKDPREVCKLLTQQVRSQLVAKKTCELTIRNSMAGNSFPKMTTKRAYRDGDLAVVTFEDSERRVTVQREEGAWKVLDGGT